MTGAIRVLLLCFGDDQYHDHGAIGAFMDNALRLSGFAVTFSPDEHGLAPATLAAHDAVVMYAVSATADPGRIDALCAAVRGDAPNDRGRPVGLVGVHGVTTSFQEHDEWKRLIGASFVSHPDMGPAYRFTVTDASHPAVRGVADFNLRDELYFFDVHSRFSVLLAGEHEGRARPVMWHKPFGAGRVCYLALGHGPEQLGNANVRRLIDNAARWTAGRDD